MLSKVQKNGISLNRNKCTFMVFSRMILSFVVSKQGKLPNPKKNISNSKHATTLKSIANSSIQWYGVVLQMFHQKIYCYYGTYY